MKETIFLKKTTDLTVDEALSMADALTDPEFCENCEIWIDGDRQSIVTDNRRVAAMHSILE